MPRVVVFQILWKLEDWVLGDVVLDGGCLCRHSC